jgi:hypothetical protein
MHAFDLRTCWDDGMTRLDPSSLRLLQQQKEDAFLLPRDQ